MNRELKGTNEVMTLEVHWIFMVVYIIHFDFIVLSLFEVVLDIEGLHPGWAQVVHDNFSDAQTVPLVARLSIQDHHSISPGECVQVWKILAGERESDRVHKAALVCGDTLIDSCQDGIVKVTAHAGLPTS